MAQVDQRTAYVPDFWGGDPVARALDELAASGVEARGAVYTRREVVEFILDIVGYTTDQPLYEKRILEPAFGRGDFLDVMVERLLAAATAAGRTAYADLADAVRAVELHQHSFSIARQRVSQLVRAHGIDAATAQHLADTWLINDDFLLVDLEGGFDCVVGNPPYVRQEAIPDALVREYRRRFTTIYDRADLYIPFIERALRLLDRGGGLGFICSDRWMKNNYGAPLRRFVAENFHLKAYVDMVDTPAFESEVVAYPAITLITRDDSGPTFVARQPEISTAYLRTLAADIRRPDVAAAPALASRRDAVAAGSDPWIFGSVDALAVVRRLEARFPTIEEAGCTVGIGVATGADKIFIGLDDALDVEDERKLPLAMTRDIASGEVAWRGRSIINPYQGDGQLVPLAAYPRLRRYLERHKDTLAKRHTARKNPGRWYKTIDRIYPSLTETPKLLIPDIKGEANIVYEPGRLYPHHNLYYVVSAEWDLRALQAVLRSKVAELFIASYATRMRGGYLRFQAQYLRRIRLPRWHTVPPALRRALVHAAEAGDKQACDAAACELYGLSEAEQDVLTNTGS